MAVTDVPYVPYATRYVLYSALHQSPPTASTVLLRILYTQVLEQYTLYYCHSMQAKSILGVPLGWSSKVA